MLRLATVALVVAGCTSTSGPYITNITRSRPGVLVVEKCMVEYSQFTETVSTKNCRHHEVDIGLDCW